MPENKVFQTYCNVFLNDRKRNKTIPTQSDLQYLY